jgi:hypothetical protein
MIQYCHFLLVHYPPGSFAFFEPSNSTLVVELSCDAFLSRWAPDPCRPSYPVLLFSFCLISFPLVLESLHSKTRRRISSQVSPCYRDLRRNNNHICHRRRGYGVRWRQALESYAHPFWFQSFELFLCFDFFNSLDLSCCTSFFQIPHVGYLHDPFFCDPDFSSIS